MARFGDQGKKGFVSNNVLARSYESNRAIDKFCKVWRLSCIMGTKDEKTIPHLGDQGNKGTME